MNANRSQIYLYAVLILAWMLTACSPIGVQVVQPSPSLTPQPGATQLPSITPLPTDIPTIAVPSNTPVVISPAPGGDASNVITLDNNNQLITLHPGETFLLKLGEIYQWEPVIDNQNVISRVMNVMVIRGAQGLYNAHQAGTATLTATGDPLCRQSKPACGMPSILFTLHIEVLA